VAKELANPTLVGTGIARRQWVPEFLRRLVKEKPLGSVGGALVLLVVLAAVLADVVAPYGYQEPDYTRLLNAPSLSHPLGTDNFGRDLLSRIIYGARVTMYVALGAVGLGVAYALVLGLASAWFGGAVDTVIGRIIDVKMAIPYFLLMLVVSAILGPGLLNIILVLSLWGISEARVVRSQALTVKENVYVDAARVLGCGSWHMVRRHLLPNVMAPVIILASLRFGTVILAEASLSFLGYGIPPPYPSWGRMLGQESRLFLFEGPWLAIFPGLALSMAVWGFNILGDAMRDLLDPRLRGTGARYR
jgi:peptide/nickel transport system permease protein